MKTMLLHWSPENWDSRVDAFGSHKLLLHFSLFFTMKVFYGNIRANQAPDAARMGWEPGSGDETLLEMQYFCSITCLQEMETIKSD